MEQKASNWLVLLLVLLVLPASSHGVPISRGLRMFNNKEVAHGLLDSQEIVDIGDDGQLSNIHGVMERRMDLETLDYPGTGANNVHNPRGP